MVPRLILITRDQAPDARFWETVEAALAGGVEAVLLRMPSLGDAELLAAASRARMLTRRYRAQLFVRARFDIAEAVEADGVHLPASLAVRLAAQGWRAQPGRMLSAAAHNAEELAAANRLRCAFALLSPVFPTRTHPKAKPLGVEGFRRLATRAGVPVVALGGITPANRRLLAGFPVAVVSAIFDAEDPKRAAEDLRCMS
ncbi:MAG: thiamine phosphate synthase [Zetaproteobacteria bacterium]|nr:MAG: thiamine phosphate synthase [Zetaproteobacteria bacterium]